MKLYQTVSLTALVFASTFLVAGCGSDKPVAQNGGDESSSTAVSHDDHSGWWCKEHAIPEEECSMCSAAAAKEFRDKGDWCEEHNRAESQCFICDPSRAEKYAKLYEAKYGEKPPAATE
jgi:hypothetical protein